MTKAIDDIKTAVQTEMKLNIDVGKLRINTKRALEDGKKLRINHLQKLIEISAAERTAQLQRARNIIEGLPDRIRHAASKGEKRIIVFQTDNEIRGCFIERGISQADPQLAQDKDNLFVAGGVGKGVYEENKKRRVCLSADGLAIYEALRGLAGFDLSIMYNHDGNGERDWYELWISWV